MVPFNYFSSFRVPFRIGLYSLDCVFDLGLRAFRNRSFSPPSGDGGHHGAGAAGDRQQSLHQPEGGSPGPRLTGGLLCTCLGEETRTKHEYKLNIIDFMTLGPITSSPAPIKGGEDLEVNPNLY